MTAEAQTELVARIKDALRRVIDPELGCNIVDLGLIYNIVIEEGGLARVTMTTTTLGCPATSYLVECVHDSVCAVPGVELAKVELTLEPPWTPQMMSREARDHLGIDDGGEW